jgi:hypothetical protein
VTLALAVITVGLVIVGVWSLLQTRHALKQTQDAIELSRAEVREAHRPVLAPVNDTSRMIVQSSNAKPHLMGVPQFDGEALLVPLANVGLDRR